MSEEDSAGLDPGEQVIWSGRPDPIGYAWYKGRMRLLYGLVMTILCVSLVNLNVNMARPALRSPVSDSLWWSNALMTLVAVFLLVTSLMALLAPLRYFFEARRARYTLTNRRAIISVGPPFSSRQSFPIGALPFVEVQSSSNERGHVLFAATGAQWSRGPAKDGFLAVPEPRRVERLLREAALASPPRPLAA